MADTKKPLRLPVVWQEAKDLIQAHRRYIVLGLGLMVVNRVSGLALPVSSKFLIDEVVGNDRRDLLLWLALGVGAATLVQAATSFSLSQVLSITAQRAIMDMRKVVQAHVTRLADPLL